jgi:hypothetical protein
MLTRLLEYAYKIAEISACVRQCLLSETSGFKPTNKSTYLNLEPCSSWEKIQWHCCSGSNSMLSEDPQSSPPAATVTSTNSWEGIHGSESFDLNMYRMLRKYMSKIRNPFVFTDSVC